MSTKPGQSHSHPEDTFQFLATCSDVSLDNFVLSRYAKDRDLKKQIAAKLEEAIDVAGELRAAEWIREYRIVLRGGR